MLATLAIHGDYSAGRVPVLLIADDDEDILMLVQLRLSRSGYEVVVARDGEEALQLAREKQPDLVVLDWMMPKASGLEVLRAMRADESVASIPVVLLTARVSESDIQEGMDAGADDYIAKPFSPQELASRIQTILARA
jgi:two-component system, OmpR family, response regulator MtrA